MNIFDLIRSRSQWGSELGRILPVIITSNEVWKRKKYKIFVNSSFEDEKKFSKQKSDGNIFMNNFWVRVENQFFERLSLVRSSLKSLYRPRFHNSSERTSRISLMRHFKASIKHVYFWTFFNIIESSKKFGRFNSIEEFLFYFCILNKIFILENSM